MEIGINSLLSIIGLVLLIGSPIFFIGLSRYLRKRHGRTLGMGVFKFQAVMKERGIKFICIKCGTVLTRGGRGYRVIHDNKDRYHLISKCCNYDCEIIY